MTAGAVLTADIAGSTRLPKASLSKLLKQLSQVLQPYTHEFFRGDSCQVFVKDPAEAYTILLRLRVIALRIQAGGSVPASDVRASIGIGPVRLPLKTIRTATDEAFVLSGRLFETMKPPDRLLVAAPENNTALNTGLRVIGYFTDYIFARMTVKQAEVVHQLLLQKTQTEAAKALKKSQAAIHKHAQAAGWPELEKLTLDYQALIKAITP